MTKEREAMKLALEALEKCDFALAEELAAWDIDPPIQHVLEASNACGPAITAVKEALAEQPAQQQEPVAVVKALPMGHNQTDMHYAECQHLPVGTLLYKSPPAQRKPLTDEHIEFIRVDQEFDEWAISEAAFRYAARAIEAAHGIKE